MKLLFISITIFLLLYNTNLLAVEIIDKIKNERDKISKEGKSIFKTLTRKSLTETEVLSFVSEYVIEFDDGRGDGLVTYFFEDAIYKRYKNLEIISEGFWGFSMLGKLKISNNNKNDIWGIQPAKQNTIRIKKRATSVGKLYEFSYKRKTDFYLKLEEKKINSNN